MATDCKWRLGILAAAAIAMWPVAGIADCRAASPDYTLALFELYTSEGCDSCPPADRWFSALDLGRAENHAVALAFHVDYWDHLGWRDRLGSAAFTERQYEQMRRQRTEFVYTPQVLLQGRDFPQWRTSGDAATAIADINARPARATIELVAEATRRDASVDLHVRVPNNRDRKHALIIVALTQSGLVSDVRGGENAGKRLAHDHVVRQWRTGAALDSNGEARERVNFALPVEQGAMTIVAVAEDTASGEVLQVLALPLCARP